MDISYIQTLIPVLLSGAVESVKIFLLTFIFALPLGLPFALGVRSKILPIKVVSELYIWVFRGTPLMLQLFFVYFGLPSVGIVFDRFTAAVVTFVLNYSAYFAEIYRGGISSIDNGQTEAAKTLGFSPWQTMEMIIIPQAIRSIIPPVSNEAITLVKDTALVTAIGVSELLKKAKDAVNRDINITAYVLAAIFYLIFTFVLTILCKKIEQYFSRHERTDV